VPKEKSEILVSRLDRLLLRKVHVEILDHQDVRDNQALQEAGDCQVRVVPVFGDMLKLS